MRILVTGATGTVGGHVARQLSGTGREVIALLRDPAKADLPADVEVVRGDLTNPEDLQLALRGVDRLFLNLTDDNGATFAKIAPTTGLQPHVVLL